jgi:hypothetical protein
MRRRALSAALVSVSICVMLLGGCGGDSGGNGGPSEPVCKLDVESLAFGSVSVGGSHDLTFKLTNTGGGTLAGTVSEACADFAIVGTASYSLGAGDSATFTVRFSPASVGSKVCTIETGASGCADLPCSGTGIVTSPCQVIPTSLDFGTVTIGHSRNKTFTITNTAAGTLAGSVGETCDDYGLVFGGGAYSLATDESVTVTVTFIPTTAGTHTCSISTGASCAEVACTGVGELGPECDLSLSSIDFGTVTVGAQKDTTFTIRNTGGGTLSGDVYAECDEFSIVGNGEFDLVADQSAEFTVRFAPTSAGPAECWIDMDSGLCDGISCTGSGELAPVCELDPTGLDFGLVEIGSSTDLSFTIRNTGGGTLSGTVSSPCGGFSIIGSAAYSLGPQESATFTVRFTPVGVGGVGCAIETGSGYCGDVASTGVSVPHADYYVDASRGSDTNPGTLGAPFKTVTHAVASAGPSKVIFIAPGTYDTALGETFPISLQSGESLLGDVPNKGAGPTPTIIYGSGDADPAPGNDLLAAILGADGASISGLSISAPYTATTHGIYFVNASVSITDNTLGSETTSLYGGVYVVGNGVSAISRNDFKTVSYGTYCAHCTGGMIVESNLFESMSIPVDVAGTTDNSTFRGNTFVGSGQCGIQVQGGAPLIENNTFNKPGGYANYGAIVSNGGAANPMIRGNTFVCARGIRIIFGTADIGTAPDPGGNNFSGVTGAAIYHGGTGAVNAVGNTWANQPPGCGTDIVITDVGTVTWGTGVGESCPLP